MVASRMTSAPGRREEPGDAAPTTAGLRPHSAIQRIHYVEETLKGLID